MHLDPSHYALRHGLREHLVSIWDRQAPHEVAETHGGNSSSKPPHRETEEQRTVWVSCGSNAAQAGLLDLEFPEFPHLRIKELGIRHDLLGSKWQNIALVRHPLRKPFLRHEAVFDFDSEQIQVFG